MDNIFRTPKSITDCKRCSLQCGESIHSHCFSEFVEAQAFVVSAYPGNQELKTGLTLAPYAGWTKYSKRINAGTYLQEQFIELFDKDKVIPNTYKPFYDISTIRGNAIRCIPRKGKEQIKVTSEHLDACRYWLQQDIRQLSNLTPILLCGKEAVLSLFGDRPNLIGGTKGKPPSLYKLRRQIWFYNNHPVIITENPIQAVNSLRYSIIKETVNDKGVPEPKTQQIELPPPLGSTGWHFNRDLELLKLLILFKLDLADNKQKEYLASINGFTTYRALVNKSKKMK
jgi:uracil-DNA glycosylase